MTGVDQLLKNIGADLGACKAHGFTTRAKMEALKRMERNARRARKRLALEHADTLDPADTSPSLTRWSSPSRLITNPMVRLVVRST